MSEFLYNAGIKELAQAAHGHGRLPRADAAIRLDNPLCGDRIDLELALAGNMLVALAHVTRGCLLCRAAASLLALRAPGHAAAEIAALSGTLRQFLAAPNGEALLWNEIEFFAPVSQHRSRHGCVLLPFDALRDALESCSIQGIGGVSRDT